MCLMKDVKECFNFFCYGTIMFMTTLQGIAWSKEFFCCLGEVVLPWYVEDIFTGSVCFSLILTEVFAFMGLHLLVSNWVFFSALYPRV